MIINRNEIYDIRCLIFFHHYFCSWKTGQVSFSLAPNDRRFVPLHCRFREPQLCVAKCGRVHAAVRF